MRLAACCVLAGLVAVVACVASELRPQGGDTVPGRLGAAVLACRGDFDLRDVDWLGGGRSGRAPSFVRVPSGGEMVSTYGPAPAAAGSLAMASLKPGGLVGDRALMRRARYAAAACVGLAAALLCLALGAVTSPMRALAASAVAALSFAGAATLGQALWQQTVALPAVTGALATLAWGRHVSALMATPALLALSGMIRPPAAGVLIGLGLAWLLALRQVRRRALCVAAAALTSLVVVAPFAIWNQRHHQTPLPVGQISQAQENSPRANGQAFDTTPAHMAEALAGLIVSPGRGLLFFAPVVLVALVSARRGNALQRSCALGVLLEIGLIGSWVTWWGGITFGPRLLAETVWIGVFALGAALGRPDAPRWLGHAGGAAAAWTLAVGLLGLARDPLQWEMRRNPDVHREALWDLVEGPVAALVSPAADREPVQDAPAGPFLFCAPRTLMRPELPRAP